GYDGSDCAKTALAKAIELAKETGDSIAVVFGFHIFIGGGEVGDYRRAPRRPGRGGGAAGVAGGGAGGGEGGGGGRRRHARRRPDPGRRGARRTHDRGRDSGRGSGEERAGRLDLAEAPASLVGAGARRAGRLMAVDVVELDRARIAELIEREGAALNERTGA